jgi:hypothetical protein
MGHTHDFPKSISARRENAPVRPGMLEHRCPLPLLLIALVAVTAHTQADTVQIRLAGESGPIALPLNQRLSAWTKIYGPGYHNSDVPASLGWSMAWWFHRVCLVATFYGQPPIATRVTITAKEGQKSLSLVEATEIARSLGLKDKQVDPSMESESTFLWPSDHLSLRYGSEPALEQTLIELWTDQDPKGDLPVDE